MRPPRASSWGRSIVLVGAIADEKWRRLLVGGAGERIAVHARTMCGNVARIGGSNGNPVGCSAQPRCCCLRSTSCHVVGSCFGLACSILMIQVCEQLVREICPPSSLLLLCSFQLSAAYVRPPGSWCCSNVGNRSRVNRLCTVLKTISVVS